MFITLTMDPYKPIDFWGAAIAQWIRLRLPSYRPGFESQANHLRFFIYSICAIFEAGFGPFKKTYRCCFYCSATHAMSQVLQPKSVNKRYRVSHI